MPAPKGRSLMVLRRASGSDDHAHYFQFGVVSTLNTRQRVCVDDQRPGMLSGVSGGVGASRVQLRRLTVEDWALWREVRLRALADAPQAFDSTLTDWQGEGDAEDRWRSRLVDVPFNLVGTIDGEAIGQVSGTALDDRGRCELISMWVDASVRGRGVGGALIDGVAEWALSVGASALVLSVRQSNTHAVDLYTRASFVPIDEPAGDRCDLRMRRDLR